MKKSIVLFLILIAIFLVAIVSFGGYKIYLLNKYDIDDGCKFRVLSEEIETSFINNNDNLGSYKNAKFMLFDGFKFISDISLENGEFAFSSFVLDFKSEENYGAIIKVGTSENLYSNLVNSFVSTYGFDLKDIDIKRVFKDNNIDNNGDLYKAILEDCNSDISIFDSKSDMEYVYLIRNLGKLLPENDITIIDGEYDGYLITINNSNYEAHLFNGNDEYVFRFVNNSTDYFDFVKVKEFLNSVRIN